MKSYVFLAAQKFKISGFKAFDKKGITIEEKSLTVLTGKNSSGKSSFLEAIIFKNEISTIIKTKEENKKNKGIIIDLNKLSAYKKGLKNIINRNCDSIIVIYYNTADYSIPCYEVEIDFIVNYSKEILVSRSIKMKRINGEIIYSIDYLNAPIYFDESKKQAANTTIQNRVFENFNYGSFAFSLIFDKKLPNTYKYLISLADNTKEVEILANEFFTTNTYFELSSSELLPYVEKYNEYTDYNFYTGYWYRENLSSVSIFDLLYEIASIVNNKKLTKLEAISYLKDKNNRTHLIQSKIINYNNAEISEINLFYKLMITLLDDLQECFELLYLFYKDYDKLVSKEIDVFNFESKYYATAVRIRDIYNLRAIDKDGYDRLFKDSLEDHLDSLYSVSYSVGDDTFEKVFKIATHRTSIERTHGFDDKSLLSEILNLLEMDENKNERINKLNEWLSFLDIASSMQIKKFEDRYSVILINKVTYQEENIKDLGFGYSKLLPILIQLTDCLFSAGKTILIEEPESNLHPALQSKLAHIFCDKEFKKNLIIIETHSEYLIRKLQYLTAKKEIKPEDTQIYYFYPPNEVPEGEKQVYPINIQEDGSLTKNFGKGFFDEAGNLDLLLYQMTKTRSN